MEAADDETRLTVRRANRGSAPRRSPPNIADGIHLHPSANLMAPNIDASRRPQEHFMNEGSAFWLCETGRAAPKKAGGRTRRSSSRTAAHHAITLVGLQSRLHRGTALDRLRDMPRERLCERRDCSGPS